jgi:hypothetical protein
LMACQFYHYHMGTKLHCYMDQMLLTPHLTITEGTEGYSRLHKATTLSG